MKLIILTGIPGSGLLALAARLKGFKASARDFTPPELWRYIHCALLEQVEQVVIQVGPTALAMSPYVLMAEALGYQVEIWRVLAPRIEAFEATTGISRFYFNLQADKFDSFTPLPEWNVIEV